ncbi:hypothetical protein ACFQY4_25015 [Catellatospora bangladeshensis]|uniref:hypothetical protein n=1 Tax=Catellatospora bangladeshensis TaxID=310355 RepID=UPI00361381EE
MIRFGIRMSLAGGREAATRLAVIAAAVALGVGMLLASVAGMNAVGAQNQRYAWLNSAIAPQSAEHDPMWWTVREDYFHARSIGRVEVAALGPDAPVPPGLPRVPAAGEYYASPALVDLLGSTPPRSWATVSRAGRLASSPTRDCRRRTRCSSSSDGPRPRSSSSAAGRSRR